MSQMSRYISIVNSCFFLNHREFDQNLFWLGIPEECVMTRSKHLDKNVVIDNTKVAGKGFPERTLMPKRRSGNQKLLSFNARWVGWICAQTQYRRYLMHISDICSRGASSSASSHPVAMVGRSSRRNSSASASAAKHLSSFDSIVCPGSHNTTSYFIPVSVHRAYPEATSTLITSLDRLNDILFELALNESDEVVTLTTIDLEIMIHLECLWHAGHLSHTWHRTPSSVL
ncbi:uncharacterized protein ARMOST_20974 [Armillaria ostoyae]|uniref:Uncharacterized protein n=1 Tax=Armillaria ostoyae TaxID=47428 RepID=A0A284S8T2_ARMOS|nr:uncharacterized protein ARMOST_20974 [Armillaria ostoyae]